MGNRSKIKFSFYLDRTLLADLPETLSCELRARGLHTKSGEKSSYCGFIRSNDSIDIFLPRKILLSSNTSDSIIASKNMMASIAKYISSGASAEYDNLDGELVGENSFYCIYSIMEDYRNNGIYSRRISIKKKNSGRPDWRSTISKEKPVNSKHGFIYLNIHGKSHKYSVESEVSRIHLYIINKIVEDFSSLLGLTVNILETHLPPPASTSNDYLKTTLKRELEVAFSDRDIFLLKSMITYIDDIGSKDTSSLAIGVKNFEHLWEHMLRNVIYYVAPLQENFPFPAAKKSSDGLLLDARRKKQKVDIFLHDVKSNALCVIDAKYYDATDTQSLPGSKDIIKQYFYVKSLRTLFPKARIENCFLFPGTHPAFTSIHMKSDDGSLLDSIYEPISCFYVDPNHIIQLYSQNSKSMDLTMHLLQKAI